MEKKYMLKFSSLFIKDYLFTNKELMNYENLIDTLEQVVKIALAAEDMNTVIYDIKESSEIIVEVKEVVNDDEIVDIDDYLITFTNKYSSSFFNLHVGSKDLYCF